MSQNRPKRILIVDEGASFGGSLVVAANIVRFLDSSRYIASLVCEVDAAVLGDRIGKDDLVTVRRNFTYVDRVRWLDIFQNVKAPLVRRIVSHLISGYAFIRNYSYRRDLKRTIQIQQADLIHTNNNLDVVDIATRLHIPIVRHIHGIVPEKMARADRRASQQASRVIAISNTVANSARGAGIDEERLVVLENPCAVPQEIGGSSRSASRSKYGIPDSAHVFGIVGRVVPWKGQKEFLDAAECVLDSDEHAIAVIVGDASEFGGEYEQEVLAKANGFKHRSRIIFTGFVQDVDSAYQLLDVLVHCSIEPEPFGLVITEAMSHGIAVVAANIGAPPEIITNGIDGYLINPADFAAIAERVSRLLDNKELRLRIAETGRKMVGERYDPSQYCDKLANVYDSVFLDRTDLSE